MTNDTTPARVGDALLPCPWCGVAPCPSVQDDGDGWLQVWCMHCDAMGPRRADDRTAEMAWNRRIARTAAKMHVVREDGGTDKESWARGYFAARSDAGLPHASDADMKIAWQMQAQADVVAAPSTPASTEPQL